MKVLMYIHQLANVITGVHTSTEQIITALKLAGVDVTTDPNDTYDLVDMSMTFSGESKKFFKKIRKNRNVPVLVHAHSTRLDFVKTYRYDWLTTKVCYDSWVNYQYERCDKVIAVSPLTKAILEPQLIYKNIPIEICPNPIDLTKFEADKAKVKKFEETFKISPTDKVIIGSGILCKRKGILDFFEIAKKFPDIKFFWFGGFTKSLVAQKIRNAIKHKPENVIMPGFIRNDIFFGALQRANCVLFTSYAETDGLVPYEAFASRTPVVLRDIFVYNKLQHGKHCFKSWSIEDFCENIKYVLSHDTKEVADNAYEFVKVERDPKTIGIRLKEIYEKALAEFKAKENN